MREKVSVIVSVYNVESVLENTLRCISGQTYSNLEIILVDDGSTDSSVLICDDFAKTDSRCIVIHKENGGQGSAKNAGQKIASGDYLFFPDGDDTFSLDMVRILHDSIIKDPEYDLAIAGRDIVYDYDSSDTPLSEEAGSVPPIEYSRDDLIRGLFSKKDDRFVYGWNKLYRKELLDGLWCGDYPRHQDFDFNFRVFLKARKAVYVDRPLYHWVQRAGQKTRQAESWGIHLKCRAEIMYDNYLSQERDGGKYGHYLLDALYRDMLFWEEWSRKSGNLLQVKASCRGYMKKTRKAYVKVRGISFYRKAVCLALLTFPNLSHLIMRMTSNAR